MANSPNYGFYLPDRNDDLYVDETLQEMVLKIDGELKKANDYSADAHSKAEYIQTQLDTVLVDGDSSVEAAQARINADGVVYSTLKKRLDDADYKFTDAQLHAAGGKKILSVSAYPRIIPEASDTARIQRAINAADEGSILVFQEPLYEMTGYAENVVNGVDKVISLLSFGSEMRAMTEGMDAIFRITDVNGFFVSGFKFNQNLKGRTTMDIARCSNFVVEKCYVTGYSKEYGYYKTDGGIRMTDVTNGKIVFNTWEDHGYQYSNATENLNRCLQIGGTASDNILVLGNTFNRVNQAIVTGSGNHIIIGNHFVNIRDNVLYQVDFTNRTIFSGNYVDHRYDEALVVDVGSITVTSNQFKNVPNKVVSIGGNCETIIIQGNTFTTPDITSMAQFIAWRDATKVVKRMLVSGNTFRCLSNTNNYDYFSLGSVELFTFTDNLVEVITQDSQKMLAFVGATAKGLVAFNTFIGTNSTSFTYHVTSSVTDYDMLYKDNDMTNCRASFARTRVEGHVVQFNAGPYILAKPKLNRIYSDAMPTQGTFTAGDYSAKLNPTVGGVAGSQYVVKGWIRLTTGSNHVLNTDWVEDRSLTGA